MALHLPAGSVTAAAPPSAVAEPGAWQQQQQRRQGPLLQLKSPALLPLVMHEVGHALSMLLSARATPHSVFGGVGFASTDVQELASHIMER